MSVDWGTFGGLVKGSAHFIAVTAEFTYHVVRRKRQAKPEPVLCPLRYC